MEFDPLVLPAENNVSGFRIKHELYLFPSCIFSLRSWVDDN
jgi:hypothetical protein